MELKDIKEYRDKVKAAQFEAGAKMFLDRIFSNLEVKLDDKYTDSIFYEFNNEVVFEYDKKTNYFYYDYDKIYKVLLSEFGLNYIKINELIVDKVEEHLKFRGVTPALAWNNRLQWVEEHLKFRGVTPNGITIIQDI